MTSATTPASGDDTRQTGRSFSALPVLGVRRSVWDRDGVIVLARPRLVRVLARRHQLDLLVLEAPGGSGRTVLLDQALAEPVAGATDVRVDVTPADAVPGALAGRILGALGHAATDGPADPARAAAAIAAAAAGHAPVALVLDGVERAGVAGASLVTALVEALGPGCGLVVSGRWLPPLGRATRVAAGTAAVLGPADLALRSDEVRALAERGGAATADRELMAWPAPAQLVATGHPDLVPHLLHEILASTVDDGLAAVLLALAVVGGAEPAVAEPVAAAVAPAAAGRVATLARLPLVRVGPEGIWPHPIWASVADRDLDPGLARTALVAAGRARLAQGALVDAGRLALRAGDGDLLAATARAALSALPALVPDAELDRWLISGLLAADGIEARWVEAVLGDDPTTARAALDRIRAEVAATGDLETEMAVHLPLGRLALQADDIVALATYVTRGDELAAAGVAAARPLSALGRAVGLQLQGRYRDAVAALDELAPRAVRGDLGAQVLMVRGTNLLLAGEGAAARAAYTAAGALGSTATRAVAHHLQGLARWMAGDAGGAIDEARLAVDLAVGAGVPGRAAPARAVLDCYLALSGRPPDPDRRPSGSATGEVAALATVAEVGRALAEDPGSAEARALLGALDPAPNRAATSTMWRAALETALVDGADERWAALGTAHPPIARAVDAGRAAAAHLAGGPPAPARARPFLPVGWCEPAPRRIEIDLMGPGQLRIDGQPSDHPGWRRHRVRELALHLAVHPLAARRQVAADLWPDLDESAAGRNLRVNLTHLLDLLDPDRGGERSALLVDDPTVLGLAAAPHLTIDVRVVRDACTTVARAGASGDTPTVLGAARVLLDHAGRLLDGGAGEWAAGVQHDLDEDVLRAVGVAGPLALDAGLADLADALGRRAVTLDRWVEGAHRLVVAARLQVGDVDGARRAAIGALVALDELHVAPAPETLALVLRTGLRPPWPRSAG